MSYKFKGIEIIGVRSWDTLEAGYRFLLSVNLYEEITVREIVASAMDSWEGNAHIPGDSYIQVKKAVEAAVKGFYTKDIHAQPFAGTDVAEESDLLFMHVVLDEKAENI